MTEPSYTKVDPAPIVYSQQEEIYGTLYPAINEKHSGLTPMLMSLRSALGTWYPFAQRQVGGSDRVAFAPRMDNSMRMEEPYPNRVTFANHYPSHYDPYKDTRAQQRNILTRTYPADYSVIKLRAVPPPRGCVRQLDFFNRCMNIHNRRAESCENEALNIINQCPSFALEDLRHGKIYQLKVQAIDEKVYKEAMAVSDYNKGRTMAHVSTKSWRDGQRDKLRPDSMYPDERYTNVTQPDIDAAKARIDKKKAEGKINTVPQPVDPNPPYDWEHVSVKGIKNIYD